VFRKQHFRINTLDICKNLKLEVEPLLSRLEVDT
jgi:hypothetical protein